MARIRSGAFAALLLALTSSAMATTVVIPTDEQLVDKTPIIVTGRVLSTGAVEDERGIHTVTEILVEKNLRGTTASTIRVRELGGRVEDRLNVVFGTPEFTEGERVLLFLAPSPLGDYRTRDMFLGKFSERRAQDGTPVWYRANRDGVNVVDRHFRETEFPSIQRRRDGFEDFIGDRISGRPASKGYQMENPLMIEASEEDAHDRISANFTLISEPTIYRWSSFDNLVSAPWYSVSSQPGYSGGGVNELRSGMAGWTSYSEARVLYQYSGESTKTPGGMKSANGINEVIFNDVTNDIDGSYSPRTGGVVGVGGFNKVANGGSWTAPFTADSSHTAGTYSTYAITEANMVIQDGVSAANGISAAVLAEIIAHEFGHTLGFGHSADGTALMYKSVTGSGASLKADDQVAARWLYPNGSGGGSEPAPQPPAAPSSLAGSLIDATSAKLTWKDNASDETSQKLYAAKGNGSFSVAGTLAANATAVNVGSLAAGTTYKFYITAVNGAGESSPSNTVQVTTPSSVTLPAAPANLVAATLSTSSIRLQWSDIASNETSQSIYRAVGTGSFSRIATVGAGVTIADMTGLSAGTTYRFYVTASNSAGESAASNTAQATTQSAVVNVNASFTFSPSSPSTATDITFTDASSGSPTSWKWNFGDGTTSTSRNPVKRYANPGTYTVTLTASSSSGSSTMARSVSVSSATPAAPAVAADFEFSPATPTAGVAVAFTDRSSGNPTAWKWQFGDGNSSSSRNPSHVFTAAGTYHVTLTASSSSSSASRTRTVIVSAEPRFRSVLPVAAQTAGVGSTYWRTELSIFNAGPRGVTVDLRFLPGAGGAGQSRRISLNRDATVTWENALRDLFGVSAGSGALLIESVDYAGTPDLRVSSRTFTDGTTGTYGQFVPDQLSSDEAATLYLSGIDSNATFRTNLGLANASDRGNEVVVTLYESTGALVGETRINLAPGSFQQTALTSLFPAAAGRNLSSMSARLRASSGSGWYAYASVVDNRSQDPVYLRALPSSASRDQVIPAVGRTAGAAGTFWRSDVSIFNPGTSSVTASMYFLAAGSNNSSAAPKAVTVPAGRTVRIADVLSTFGVASGSGALRLVNSTGTLVVSSRTYTTRNDGGSYGQSIDAVLAGNFSGAAAVTGLKSTSTYRTNVGLVNSGTSPITAVVTLHRADGSVAGTTRVGLGPRSQTQATLAALFPNVNAATLGNVTVRARSEGGATLFAYGSVIDNRSGDPVFIGGR